MITFKDKVDPRSRKTRVVTRMCLLHFLVKHWISYMNKAEKEEQKAEKQHQCLAKKVVDEAIGTATVAVETDQSHEDPKNKNQ